MIHAGTKMYETIGPSRMALDGAGGMWLLSHGKLHHFGPDGARRETADLGEMGAPRRPSDFDMHRDGRAVIADPDTSELVRCTLPKGPCERLPARLKTLPGQEFLPLNAAKVHVDDAGGRYYVSDNYGGRVVAMDFAGNVLARTKPGVLHHPNQLSLTAPDRLTVVNTDSRDLVTFDVNLERVLDTMSTNAPGFARRARVLPFDSVRLPDGGIAVLIAMPGMRDADLVDFEAGVPAWRADLGADSDPFDVELWRGKLWVSDATRYRIDAVNLDGSRGGTLDDAAFMAELDVARDEPAKWRTVRRIAQAALVGLPLLGALLLWRVKPSVPGSNPKSPPHASRSFGAPPSLLRLTRIVGHVGAWAGLLVCVALAGLLLHFYPIGFFAPGRRVQAFGMLVMLLFLGAFFFTAYRALASVYERLRIEFDESGVRYRAASELWPFGGVERGEAPWEDVFADDSRLLVGKRLIAYKHPIVGRILDPDGIATLLAALPKEHRLKSREMNALAWKVGALRKKLVGATMGLVLGVVVLELLRLL